LAAARDRSLKMDMTALKEKGNTFYKKGQLLEGQTAFIYEILTLADPS
jgi:hypothetical protein